MEEVTIFGRTFKSKREAALVLKLNYNTLCKRLKSGWKDEDFERGYQVHVGNWEQYLKNKKYQKKVL